jgi:hypothetical protein
LTGLTHIGLEINVNTFLRLNSLRKNIGKFILIPINFRENLVFGWRVHAKKYLFRMVDEPKTIYFFFKKNI